MSVRTLHCLSTDFRPKLLIESSEWGVENKKKKKIHFPRKIVSGVEENFWENLSRVE